MNAQGQEIPIHRAATGNHFPMAVPLPSNGPRAPRAIQMHESRISFQPIMPHQTHPLPNAVRSLQSHEKVQQETEAKQQDGALNAKELALPVVESPSHEHAPAFARQSLHQEQRLYGGSEIQQLNIPYLTVVNPHSLPSVNSAAAEFPNDGVLRLPGNVSLHMLQC